MDKAELEANRYTGYCKNQSYKDFLAGYKKGRKDTLNQLRDEIKGEIKTLKGCKPNPLGSIEQCLADAEIQALEVVLQTIKEMRN